MRKKTKITKDTTFAELINENQEAIEILAKQGLGCGACPMAQFETLENGALGHGMDPNKLLEELKAKKEKNYKKQ